MKKNILALGVVAALALAGCDVPPRDVPESKETAGTFTVERLFTHDGCTVYRFRDNGDRRYFTRCDGAASAEASWSESCGKSCTRMMQIPTGGRP